MYDQKLYDRLVAKVLKDERTGCWLWTGSWHKSRKWPQNRYGYIGMKVNGKHRSVDTHRAMLIAIHGPLTKEQCGCHRCDVPLCINPAHLFIGSMKDNIHDSRSKNRHHEGQKEYCDRGHPLFGPNVRIQTQLKKRTGTIARQRVCLTCEKLRAQSPEYLAKARERQRLRRLAAKSAHSATPSEGA